MFQIKNMKIGSMFAFNGNLDHQQYMKEVIERFSPKICIETGTLHGWTTAFFAEKTPYVYTIEDVEETIEKARLHLEDYSNVKIILGNSIEVLPKIFQELPLDGNILFYLDAHWHDHWPLFDELRLIGEYVGSRAVIVIDDFKIPDKDYAFDSYKGVQNSLENVEPHLKKIYKNYRYEFSGGNLTFKLLYFPNQLNSMEWKIYTDFFQGKSNKATGKLLAYEQ